MEKREKEKGEGEEKEKRNLMDCPRFAQCNENISRPKGSLGKGGKGRKKGRTSTSPFFIKYFY